MSAASGPRQALRLLALFVLAWLALQLFFVLRVAAMAWIDPASTSMQRSEMWRMAREDGRVVWAQQWVGGKAIADNLARAVIASEDAGFTEHGGVEWDAIERAWGKNQRAQTKAERINEAIDERAEANPRAARPHVQPKLVGASTITQQLAKNLFLSGERNVLRKGQELLITYALEALLGKRRILEIYLNHVEWGEGLFGAQMASRYYFRTDAAKLTPMQAARLAVMLPAPKRFEKRLDSPYVLSRAATIAAGMGAVDLP